MAKKPQPDLEAIDRAMAKRTLTDEEMRLRDQFATAALHGAFVGGDTDLEDGIFARRCYELADAMIAERKR